MRSTTELLEEIRAALSELTTMLEAEGDARKFRGFTEALGLVEGAVESPEIAFELKRRILSMFMGFGSGTFNDYGIWRDDPEERRALNKKLEALSDRLYELAEAL